MNTDQHTEEIVAGLDIGTTKIACIVGRKNEQGKLEIMGMGKSRSDGVSRGVVTNIRRTVESIRAAVEQAEESAGVDISNVHVGIAGQHMRSMHHSGMITRKSLEDEIRQEDIDQLVGDMYKLAMVPGEEIIHVLPMEYAVDGEQGIKDPIGMSGVRLEGNFHIITGQVTAARNVNKCVARANLEVVDLIMEPLASAYAVLAEEEKEAGVALVDIGGGTTDIAIFSDHIIRHTAVIPFGGNIITDDIRKGCEILRNQAELLKNKFGSALASENKSNEVVCIPGLRGGDPKEISLKNLAHIIQSRMEEILEHVYFEIKNSGLERQLSGGIVLTGGGAQLRHLRQLTDYITGMSSRIGYPNEHLGQSKVEDVTSPLFATGVGLVLHGFDRAEKARAQMEPGTRPQKENAHASRMGKFFDQVLKGASEIFRDDEY